MIFIKQFDEIGRDDIDEAGGKGANLGELARRPPGAAGLRGRHRGLPRLCRRTPAGRKDRRARGPKMIPLDTTMPRHRFEPSLAMELSDSLRAEIAEAYAASARTFRLPSAPRRRRRISRRRASQGSRTPTSTSADWRICWSRSVTVGPHCGRHVRWPTERARASTRLRSAWRSWFSRWSTPRPPG